MKKLLYLFMVLLTFASCKKEEELNFDDRPEVRMNQSIEEVNTILASSPNGWIATLPTAGGGGYGFYMTFDRANQVVQMAGDLTDESASKIAPSTYRVKANAGAELIFDTYNYISLLSDPNPSSFGGVTGTGLRSDVEFLFERSTADSLILTGKKYRQVLKMVKATAAQKTAYESAQYKTLIDKFKAFFVNNANPFIEVVSGTNTLKVTLTLNSTNSLNSGKRIDLTGVLADGTTIASANMKFAYTINGVSILGDGLIWNGIKFVRMAWKDANTLAIYDSTGKEYIVNNSTVPLVPLHLLFGSKYSGLRSEYKTIYPGTSTAGADILNYFHNGLVPAITGGFAFNYGRIDLDWNIVNKRFLINGRSSQSGPTETGGWVTTSSYTYTTDASGIYKFTQFSAPSGGYVSGPLSRFYTFILNNRVVFDYFSSGGVLYGRMTSVENPAIVMTFLLK